MQRKESFVFKGKTPKKPNLIKQNNDSFFYQTSKKILPNFKILTSANILTYQYDKEKKRKKYEISKNSSFNLKKKEKVSDNKEAEEKLKKMTEELNNTIKTEEEEIKKVEKLIWNYLTNYLLSQAMNKLKIFLKKTKNIRKRMKKQ